MSKEVTSRREPQLDLLVRLMLVNLLAGLIVAALTLIFHDQIVAEQFAAAAPGEATARLREQLSTTLWSRPGPAVAVALLYPLFIRRLRGHEYRGWRRVVIVAVVQFLALGWFLLGSDYPLWLRGLQAVQLIVVVAVFVAALRRSVRALFVRPRRERSGNARAAWFLVVLTPVVAELALGSTPLSLAWPIVLWLPVYGAGVLLIRELVCRTGRGWPSLILLGLAYEIVEDGLGLQALTSPRLYGAAHWGVRVFGVNLTYWEANALYHIVFTVLIPIALTNLVFPRHRDRRYLGRRGLVLTAIIALLGLGVVRFSIPLSQDPGYQTPLVFALVWVLAVVLLAVLAMRVVPRRVHRPGSDAAALWPLAWWYAGAGITTLLVLGLTFRMLGSAQPAFTHGGIVVVPMLAALVIAGLAGWVLHRARRSSAWTERHTLAVIGGALVAHTIGGMLIFRPDVLNGVGLAVIAVVTVVLISRLDRRLVRRPAEQPAVANVPS